MTKLCVTSRLYGFWGHNHSKLGQNTVAFQLFDRQTLQQGFETIEMIKLFQKFFNLTVKFAYQLRVPGLKKPNKSQISR